MANIRLVIFDLDETIVKNTIPFSEIREKVLSAVGSRENPAHLYEFIRDNYPDYLPILEHEEINRAKSAYVDPVFEEILKFLRDNGINVAVLTRNSRKAALIALGDYAGRIDALITRDDGFPPKPAPDAIFYLMGRFSSTPSSTIMVGDYDYDIEAGKLAGCITVRIGKGDGDYVISSLKEVIKIISDIIETSESL